MTKERLRAAWAKRKDGSSLPAGSRRLAVGIFCAIAATNLLTPLLPSITAEFGITYATAGTIVSSYIFARLSASVFVGWLGARIRTTILGSIAFGTLVAGSFAGIASPNVEVLLLSRVLAGIGVGIITTLALSALAELAPARARGQVMSLFSIAHNGGVALYPVLGGIIGVLAGWRATFVVMAVGAALSAWLLVPVLRRVRIRPPDVAGSEPETDGPVFSRTRQTIGVAVVLTGVSATMFNRHGMRNTLLPLYGGDNLGLGPVEIATGLTIMSVIGIVIAMPGAMAGDRVGHRRLLVAGLAALAIGDVAFLATGDYTSFLIASVVLGLGDFFIGSQAALLASLAPTGRRTRVLSGFRVATDVGALTGPIVLAALLDALGPEPAMVAAAGILTAVAILSLFIIPDPSAVVRTTAKE